MITRQQIIDRVMGVIEELQSEVTALYPVEQLLDQAGRELLLTAPLSAIDCYKDFSKHPLTPHLDGSGEIELPSDFVRLYRFKMRGWHKEVYETIPVSSRKYAKQFHRATRGGLASPVVALSIGRIEYFSVMKDSQHTIDKAEYIAFVAVDDTYPELLIDALVWLTATLSFKVMNEYESSKMAFEEYERILTNLFRVYGK